MIRTIAKKRLETTIYSARPDIHHEFWSGSDVGKEWEHYLLNGFFQGFAQIVGLWHGKSRSTWPLFGNGRSSMIVLILATDELVRKGLHRHVRRYDVYGYGAVLDDIPQVQILITLALVRISGGAVHPCEKFASRIAVRDLLVDEIFVNTLLQHLCPTILQHIHRARYLNGALQKANFFQRKPTLAKRNISSLVLSVDPEHSSRMLLRSVCPGS